LNCHCVNSISTFSETLADVTFSDNLNQTIKGTINAISSAINNAISSLSEFDKLSKSTPSIHSLQINSQNVHLIAISVHNNLAVSRETFLTLRASQVLPKDLKTQRNAIVLTAS
jgi:uncharacterized protein YpiB (UPF0302 family)